MTVKPCIKCGATDRYKSGDCRPCARVQQQAYAHSRREAKAAYDAEYRVVNKERLAARKAEYYKTNQKVCDAKNREWSRQHPEYDKARGAKRRREHPEKEAARQAAWVKSNPAKHNAKCKRHEAAKLKATPTWADPCAIEKVYVEAHRLTRETGIKHHVDHIVPLQGKTVAGLHVEHNLQILPAKDNLGKGNRHWPDQPQ